jgi:hypothetical protein
MCVGVDGKRVVALFEQDNAMGRIKANRKYVECNANGLVVKLGKIRCLLRTCLEKMGPEVEK